MKRPKAWRNVPKDKLTTMATAADNISEAQFKLREIARPMWTDTREGLVESGLGWSHTSIKSIPHEGYVK